VEAGTLSGRRHRVTTTEGVATAAPSAVRAVGYVRVSHAEQVVSGLSLADQRQRIEHEVARRGWTLAATHGDEGVSGGTVDGRPQLLAALKSLGRGDALVCTKLDRLTRSLIDFANLVERAQREGWVLVVIDAAFDLTTSEGRAMAGMLAVFAQFERDLISERTKAGLRQAKANGVVLGRRPGLPAVGAAAGGPSAIDPRVAAAVTDLHAHGKGAGAIADALNAYGLPSPRGHRWHRSTVRRLLPRLLDQG
jgi:DNA invertase Pin-like site-specific DNA recombinase